jgi:hypothetical protein
MLATGTRFAFFLTFALRDCLETSTGSLSPGEAFMARTHILALLMACAALVGASKALNAREDSGKRKEQAREVAATFVKAVAAKDLDGVLAMAEVPFAGSMTREERAVITDPGEFKATLRRFLANAKDADKELKVRRVYTYEEFGKDKDGAKVVEFLGPVFEKLGLEKEDLVVIDEKGAAYIVRIRDRKAKLAALFK